MFLTRDTRKAVSRLILILFACLFFLISESTAEENKNNQKCIKTLKGHSGEVLYADFSSDDKYIITSSTDDTVVIWDVKKGEYLYRYEDDNDSVLTSFFSKKDNQFISFDSYCNIRTWDVKSGKCLNRIGQSYRNGEKWVKQASWASESVKLSDNGKMFISSPRNSNIFNFYDIESKKLIKSWEYQSIGFSNLSTFCSTDDCKVAALAFWCDTKKNDKDGNKIYNGFCDVYKVKTGKGFQTSITDDQIQEACFSPDEKYIAYGTVSYRKNSQNVYEYNSKMFVWDIDHEKMYRTIIRNDKKICSVVFSSDSKRLYYGTDKDIVCWDLENDKQICVFTHPTTKDGYYTNESKAIYHLAISHSGWILASTSSDKTIRLWSLENAELIKTINLKSKVNSVVVGKESQDLIIGDDSKSIKITSSTEINEFDGHRSGVNSVVLSPDKEFIASCSNDKTVRLWKTGDTDKNRKLEGHEDAVYCVKFAPNSEIVASGSKDGTIKLWDCKKLNCTETLKHADRVYSVDFSPDGKYLISGAKDKTIKVWKLKNSLIDSTLKGHEGSVYSACFSADGKYIASGSSDNTIKIWDFEKKEEIATLKEHSGSVKSVAFSNDGKHLVSGSSDKTVKIWDVENKKCLKTLLGHNDDVNTVCFSPDNKTVISGSDDSTIKIWNIEAIIKTKKTD